MIKGRIFRRPEATTDDASSASSSSDIFHSPFQAFRPSLMSSFPKNLRPKAAKGGDGGQAEKQTSLLADQSWLGESRMSPIAHGSDDLDDEDGGIVAPYHRALHESMASDPSLLTVPPSFALNERSALLTKRPATRVPPPTNDNIFYDGDNAVPFSIHPLTSGPRQQQQQHQYNACARHWDTILCWISGLYLGSIGLHDGYLWYLAYRLEKGSLPAAWDWYPFLMPPQSTLTRFGALEPYLVLDQGQPWRMITSMALCTSALEWVLLVAAFQLVLKPKKTITKPSIPRPTKVMLPDNNLHEYPFRWILLFLLSVLTGQFWMIAANAAQIDGWGELSGCASWGTCGVLCAYGILNPRQRFLCFMMTIVFVLLSFLEQPCSSFLGVTAASFFGWAYAGSGLLKSNAPSLTKFCSCQNFATMLSIFILMALWIAPLLQIAFLSIYDNAAYDDLMEDAGGDDDITTI